MILKLILWFVGEIKRVIVGMAWGLSIWVQKFALCRSLPSLVYDKQYG